MAKNNPQQGEATSQPKDEDDYDPHLHRDLEKPTKDFETAFHIIKGSYGTGVLAMPEAYKYAGMVNGTVSTFLIAAFNVYCLHMLVKSQYILCKRLKVGLLPYPETMKIACELGPNVFRFFRNVSQGITLWFFIIYQTGACCVYVIFVAVNLKMVTDHYLSKDINLNVYFLCMFIPFCLIMCLRNLKILAPFSLVGNIITLITFGAIVYYSSRDLPPFTARPAVGDLLKYPLFFGTALFSITGTPVLVSAENNMATPKSFGGWLGILNLSIGFVTISYVIVSIMGYWHYGDDIKSSITLNFPVEETLGQLIRIFYAVAIYISYGLNGFVPIHLIWDYYLEDRLKDSDRKLLWEYVLRFTGVLVTFILSAAMPFLGLLISLLGSVCLSMIGIAFPAIINICALWPDQLTKWILVKDIVIMCIAFLGATSGCYCAVNEIVLEYKAM